MDEISSGNWKVVQTKTFTKWVNNKLKKARFPPVESLFTDVSSGVAIANLLYALGKNVPRYNYAPRSRIQKMENLTIILEFIRGLNISLVNIGPEDIVDGDQKLILGLIWTLISKLSISDMLTSEFFSMREEILNWAKRVTEDYKNVHIEDLTTSWQDGLGFNAIIHKFRPALVPDFYSMDAKNKYENCEKAFKIAEESLEIPKLFDPEDIIDVIRPDEKSVMTYLSQFYQKFHPEERQMAAKDKLRNMLKAIDWSIQARNSYEKKARAFVKEKKELNEKINALAILLKTFNEEIKKILDENTELITRSGELSLLLNDIHDVHQLMNLKSYQPPADISIDKTDISYANIAAILDLTTTKNDIAEFDNVEAEELIKMKDLSREIYGITDKDQQISIVSSSEPKFNPIHLASPAKQKAVDRLRKLFEGKKGKLQKFVDFKKASSQMIEDARKMFKIKDSKKIGMITVSDMQKILRALQFDPSIIEDDFTGVEEFVSSDKFDDVLVKLSYSKMAKPQMKAAFREIGVDGVLKLDNLLSGADINGLSEILPSSKEISIDLILEMLQE